MKEDMMTRSSQGTDSEKDTIDIESVRQKCKIFLDEMVGGIILDKRVREALERYVKKTTLGQVTYSIDTDDTSVYTMYVSYYFFEKPMAIKDLEIVVHRQRWNDPYLEIALCHELGHLENALQTKDKKFIDPKNTLQKLYIEVMADRQAAKIYGEPGAEMIVSQWLKDSIKESITNNNKAVSKKANAESIVFFLVRYIFNAFFAQESRRGMEVGR